MRSAADAAASAAHWDQLAVEADSMGDWERDRGQHDGVYRAKAQTYRDAAKSCRIEAETGVAHCSCCFKPLTGRDYWKR